MKRVPTVVLVGRINVGKSTLFNRLSSSVKSMTLDYPGVTRDYVRDTIEWLGKHFDLIDTGGLTFKRVAKDVLQQKVQEKALQAVMDADVAVIVCDGIIGVLPEDREIARFLHTHHKRFIIALNKIDSAAAEQHVYEFESLGAEAVIPISAEHRRGMEDLLAAIVERLPKDGKEQGQKPLYRAMFLGRPNVGKSSLMNALVHFERSIVFDLPGTTREAVSEKIQFSKEQIILTDTPGLRRKSAVHEDIELQMVHSALQALEDTDIVLLVIDGKEGGVVDQELKLGFYAFTERYKALAIIINKSDLMTDVEKEGLATTFSAYMHLLKKVPTLTISCQSGKNVGKVLPLVQKIWEHHSLELPEERVYHLFMNALERKPLMRNEQRLVVNQVRQLAKAPITIGLGVNEPAWFGPSQLAFFENILRSEFDLTGAPIKFIVRKKITPRSRAAEDQDSDE